MLNVVALSEIKRNITTCSDIVDRMSLSTVNKQAKYGLMPKKSAGLKEILISHEIPWLIFLPCFPSYFLAPVTVARPKLSAFGDGDSSDDDTPSSGVSRVNAQLSSIASRRNATVDPIANAALSEDPSIFDFDGTYDSFKAPDKVAHKLSQPSSSDAPVSAGKYLYSRNSNSHYASQPSQVFHSHCL